MSNKYRQAVANAMMGKGIAYKKETKAVLNEMLDMVTVKHGEWKGYTHSKFYGLDKDDNPIYRDGVLYYCSECRRRSIIKTSYCPNCGADMRGDNT